MAEWFKHFPVKEDNGGSSPSAPATLNVMTV